MTYYIIMSLFDLVDNSRTDKNTLHSYLVLYDQLMQSRKESAINVLEIGIGPYKHNNGGSIQLWHDYFKNATIYALDILDNDEIYDGIKNNPRIKIFSSTDAYDEDFFKINFLDTSIKFDMILDDGPHSLKSMIQCIKLYSHVLADDGILIIEDVQSIDWITDLADATPDHLKKCMMGYDLRKIKGRWDDIVFVIDKKNL